MKYIQGYGVVKEKNKLLMLALAVGFALSMTLGMFGVTNAAKPTKLTTIQGGAIVNSAGETVTVGFDDWGYNYQARMFNGKYCDAYRDAAWCKDYKDVNLAMKWNDAWLSNKDMNGDRLLDRHYGLPGYIGSGAWLTNHMSGEYTQWDGTTWDVSGDWVVNVEYQGTDYAEDLALVQDDLGLTGTLALVGGGSPWTIISGSVVGDNIQFIGEFDANTAMTAEFTGTILLDGTMSGSWADIGGLNRVGTWTSTSGAATDTLQTWNYFVKIVAVPDDAKKVAGVWYSADNVEIGPVIWGDFAIIQEVSNDTGTGDHGLLYKSALRAGLGNW